MYYEVFKIKNTTCVQKKNFILFCTISKATFVTFVYSQV